MSSEPGSSFFDTAWFKPTGPSLPPTDPKIPLQWQMKNDKWKMENLFDT
jgi:hypothetical protein